MTENRDLPPPDGPISATSSPGSNGQVKAVQDGPIVVKGKGNVMERNVPTKLARPLRSAVIEARVLVQDLDDSFASRSGLSQTSHVFREILCGFE